MDFDVIFGYISQSYWAKGIPKSTMQKAIDNSLCFGVFSSSDEQVGFARVVTDSATFAYLADVFVTKAHRGNGLSKRMMAAIVSHPELQGLRRMALATKDAHGLYQQFGFTPLNVPELFMEKHFPDVYA